LVERAADPHSRRASLVRLTPKGRKLFRAAAKANAAWIAEFFSMLPAKDKKMFFFRAKGVSADRIQHPGKPAAK
jgi:DNA-binding MarR family transcriptional regulator